MFSNCLQCLQIAMAPCATIPERGIITPTNRFPPNSPKSSCVGGRAASDQPASSFFFFSFSLLLLLLLLPLVDLMIIGDGGTPQRNAQMATESKYRLLLARCDTRSCS